MTNPFLPNDKPFWFVPSFIHLFQAVIILLMAMGLLLGSASCTLPPINKQQYLFQFEQFIDEVQTNVDHWNQHHWENADKTFKLLARDYFQEYKDQLDKEEFRQLQQMKLQYYTIKIKRKGKDLKEKIEDWVLEQTN